jgi:hypothetical protein
MMIYQLLIIVPLLKAILPRRMIIMATMSVAVVPHYHLLQVTGTPDRIATKLLQDVLVRMRVPVRVLGYIILP